MFPMWIPVVVAPVLAGLAFALAQCLPGLGAMFVAGPTTTWAAYAAQRAARRDAGSRPRPTSRGTSVGPLQGRTTDWP